jgi:hypothetical protein
LTITDEPLLSLEDQNARQWFSLERTSQPLILNEDVRHHEEKEVMVRSQEKTALSGPGSSIIQMERGGIQFAIWLQSGCRIFNVTHKACAKVNHHCQRGHEVVRCSRQVKLRAGCISSLEITFLTQNSCHKSGVSVYQAPIVIEAEQRRKSMKGRHCCSEGVGSQSAAEHPQLLKRICHFSLHKRRGQAEGWMERNFKQHERSLRPKRYGYQGVVVHPRDPSMPDTGPHDGRSAMISLMLVK